MTAPLAVVVHPADPPAVTARRADRALEGTGARVIYRRENDSVWICGKNRPEMSACLLDVGQMLVVESSGAWRIEDAAECAVTNDALAGFSTRIEIKPCYDYRDDPQDQRGAHGSELHLILTGPDGVMVGRISTGWVGRPLAERLGTIRPPQRRDRPGVDASLHDHYPSGSGLLAHSATPQNGWEQNEASCCYIEGSERCWITGGYMISDTLLTKLVEGGDRAAFEFMAELYRDWFGAGLERAS